MNTILSMEHLYAARFYDAGFVDAPGLQGLGSNTREMKYRALNYGLEVFDPNGNYIDNLPGGFPATDRLLVLFFKSIGIDRIPREFNPSELKGKMVHISINNICDNPGGLRSVVSQFFPATASGA